MSVLTGSDQITVRLFLRLSLDPMTKPIEESQLIQLSLTSG